MATFKRRESAMYDKILPEEVFKDVVGKGVPYSKADAPAWTPDITEFFKRAFSSRKNIEAFLDRHTASNRTEWVKGVYEHDPNTSLPAMLNYFANVECRQRSRPLYRELEKRIATVRNNKGFPKNAKVCSRLAGQIVRTFRHLHPHQMEPLIAELLQSTSLSASKLTSALKDELSLHAQGSTNAEDGPMLEFLLRHDDLQQAIIRGLEEMKKDVVILAYSGDWLNPFWFWFAWHGPGYCLLRTPRHQWSKNQSSLLKTDHSTRAHIWSTRALHQIQTAWHDRLQGQAVVRSLQLGDNEEALLDHLTKVCDEFLIRRLAWLLHARLQSYAAWTLLDFNFDWL